MGRTAEGLRLSRDPRTGKQLARFTFGGRPYNLSTGETDPGRAALRAASLYQDAVNGRLVPRAKKVDTSAPFDEESALWLEHIETSVTPDTFKVYKGYTRTFAKFFKTIDQLTTVGAERFISFRLGQVGRETVAKEVVQLRRLAKWACGQKHLASMPVIETPAEGSLGQPVPGARKTVFQIFTPQEMEAILSHLPEMARSRKMRGAPYPLRARFVVAWETGLRPATLDKLRAPSDYHPGAAHLTIRPEVDKERYGRDLDISDSARAALDTVSTKPGLMFGCHDYRNALRTAAQAAGIDELRASKISDYDFRHSAATYDAQVSNNLTGIMFKYGWTDPSTARIYVKPQQAAAREVIKARAGADEARAVMKARAAAEKARAAAATQGSTVRAKPKKLAGKTGAIGGFRSPIEMVTEIQDQNNAKLKSEKLNDSE